MPSFSISLLFFQCLLLSVSPVYAGGKRDESKNLSMRRTAKIYLTVPNDHVDYNGKNEISISMSGKRGQKNAFTLNLAQKPTMHTVKTKKGIQRLKKFELDHANDQDVYRTFRLGKLSRSDYSGRIRFQLTHKNSPPSYMTLKDGEWSINCEATTTPIEIYNNAKINLSPTTSSLWISLDREYRNADIQQMYSF